MSNLIKVVGLDPSLRNWGIAEGSIDISTLGIDISNLTTVCPTLPTGKQTRQNSLDIESAKQLYERTLKACREASVIFVEVPVGSQSARAMASYGICVGILGGLRGSGINFIEVTPTEVKLAATNNKNASKTDMINAMGNKHPDAPWPTKIEKGQLSLVTTKAEHMADAIASIYAGIKTNTFQQLIQLRKQNAN